ncbi:hypothetical protein AAMO2058_001504200 [Amorphochlora amoebiformis]
MAKKKKAVSLKKIVTGAKKALEEGKHERVVKYCSEGLENREGVKPETVYAALVYLGSAQSHLKRYPEAVRSLEEAVKLFPTKIRGWKALTDTYQAMSPLPPLSERIKAFESYTKLTAKKGGERHSLALLELTGVYVEAKEWEGALESISLIKLGDFKENSRNRFLVALHKAVSHVGMFETKISVEIAEETERKKRRGLGSKDAEMKSKMKVVEDMVIHTAVTSMEKNIQDLLRIMNDCVEGDVGDKDIEVVKGLHTRLIYLKICRLLSLRSSPTLGTSDRLEECKDELQSACYAMQKAYPTSSLPLTTLIRYSSSGLRRMVCKSAHLHPNEGFPWRYIAAALPLAQRENALKKKARRDMKEEYTKHLAPPPSKNLIFSQEFSVVSEEAKSLLNAEKILNRYGGDSKEAKKALVKPLGALDAFSIATSPDILSAEGSLFRPPFPATVCTNVCRAEIHEARGDGGQVAEHVRTGLNLLTGYTPIDKTLTQSLNHRLQLALANSYMNSGPVREMKALKLFRRISQDPNTIPTLSFQTFSGLATCLLNTVKRERNPNSETLNELRSVLKEAVSKFPFADFVYGILSSLEENAKKACSLAIKAVILEPLHPNNHIILARAYRNLGGKYWSEKEYGFETLLRAAKLYPNNPTPYALLGKYYQEMTTDTTRAKRCYQKALSLSPGNIMAGKALADIYASSGQKQLLDQVLKSATIANPSARWAWSRRGHLLLQVGRYEESIGCLQSSLRCNPLDPQIWEELSSAYKMLGKMAAALKSIMKSLELTTGGDDDLTPDRIIRMYQLSEIQLDMGEMNLALNTLKSIRKYLKSEPKPESKSEPTQESKSESKSESKLELSPSDPKRAENKNVREWVGPCVGRLYSRCLFAVSREQASMGALKAARMSVAEAIEVMKEWEAEFKSSLAITSLVSALAIHQAQITSSNLNPQVRNLLEFSKSSLEYHLSSGKTHPSISHSLAIISLLLSDPKTSEPKKALAPIRKALALNPTNPVLWRTLAIATAKFSDFPKNNVAAAKAQHSLMRAVQFDPHSGASWDLMGMLYLTCGLENRARQALIRGQSLEPNSEQLWIAQGLSSLKFMSQDMSRAQIFDQILLACSAFQQAQEHSGEALNETKPLVLFGQGICSYLLHVLRASLATNSPHTDSTRELLDAIYSLEKFTESVPDSPQGFNLLGCLRELNGDLKGAEEALRTAVKNCGGVPAEMNLSRVLSGLNKGEEAIGCYHTQDIKQAIASAKAAVKIYQHEAKQDTRGLVGALQVVFALALESVLRDKDQKGSEMLSLAKSVLETLKSTENAPFNNALICELYLYISQGEVLNGRRVVQKLIRNDPTNGQAWNMLSTLLFNSASHKFLTDTLTEPTGPRHQGLPSLNLTKADSGVSKHRTQREYLHSMALIDHGSDKALSSTLRTVRTNPIHPGSWEILGHALALDAIRKGDGKRMKKAAEFLLQTHLSLKLNLLGYRCLVLQGDIEKAKTELKRLTPLLVEEEKRGKKEKKMSKSGLRAMVLVDQARAEILESLKGLDDSKPWELPREALRLYKESLKIRPNDTLIWEELSALFCSGGGVAAGQKCLQIALNNIQSKGKGNESKTQSRLLLRLASLHFFTRKYVAGIKLATEACELTPRSPAAHFLLGLVFRKARRLEEALAAFGKAYTLRVLELGGKATKTQLDYENTLDDEIEECDLSLASFNLFAVRLRQKNYETALEALEREKVLNPTLPAIYYQRGVVQQKMLKAAKKTLDEKAVEEVRKQKASTWFCKAVHMNPTSDTFWTGLKKCVAKEGS